MADKWQWRATLDDGAVITEAEVGTFTVIDRERCVAIEVVPRRGFMRRPVRIEVDPMKGQRAVFFRRRRVLVKLNLMAAPIPNGTLTVAGWESTEGNSYVVLMDNGNLVVRSNLDGV